jgi:hypothetical protein
VRGSFGAYFRKWLPDVCGSGDAEIESGEGDADAGEWEQRGPTENG